MALAKRRLMKEINTLRRNPPQYIRAVPLDTNILEFHYVIEGPPDTAYAGGWYHGKLKFPQEYPLKPPAVIMITPNGRFSTNVKLCLSMSDFHPETWNPVWSVSTILVGLLSFMLENQQTVGSIETTDAQKRSFAATSLTTNIRNPVFCRLFPELVQKAADIQREKDAARGASGASAHEGGSCSGGGAGAGAGAGAAATTGGAAAGGRPAPTEAEKLGLVGAGGAGAGGGPAAGGKQQWWMVLLLMAALGYLMYQRLVGAGTNA